MRDGRRTDSVGTYERRRARNYESADRSSEKRTHRVNVERKKAQIVDVSKLTSGCCCTGMNTFSWNIFFSPLGSGSSILGRVLKLNRFTRTLLISRRRDIVRGWNANEGDCRLTLIEKSFDVHEHVGYGCELPFVFQ